MACSVCELATYCSKQCKKQDSDHHKQICFQIRFGKENFRGLEAVFCLADLAWKFALDVFTLDAMNFAVKHLMKARLFASQWIPMGLLYLGRDIDVIKYMGDEVSRGTAVCSRIQWPVIPSDPIPLLDVSKTLVDEDESWIINHTLPDEYIFDNLNGPLRSLPYLITLAAVATNMKVKREEELRAFLEVLQEADEESSARIISESWPVLKVIRLHMNIDELEKQAESFFEMIHEKNPDCLCGLINQDFQIEKVTLKEGYEVETIVANFWLYFNKVMENGCDCLSDFVATKETGSGEQN